MPIIVWPFIRGLASGFWSFASSTLGQIVITFAVAWLWSAHHSDTYWKSVIEAEKASAKAEYQREVIRQQEAASQILSDANARAEKEAAIASELQRQIDEFNAQEPKDEQSPQPQPTVSRGACSIDGNFAGVVRKLDAAAGKAKATRRSH